MRTRMLEMNIVNMTLNLFLSFTLVAVRILPVVGDDCLEIEKCEKNEELLIPNCYCDQKCLQYNDCCKEFLETNHHGNESLKGTNDTCVILTNYKSTFTYRIGAYMIEKCLTTDEPCHVEDGNLSSLVPVTHGGDTYRNAFCARCNDVTDYKFWNVIFHVLDGDRIATSSENGELIRNEDVLKTVKDMATSTKLVYYLQPPAEYTPRFCPYDALTKSNADEDGDDDDFNDADDRVQHLNPVSCNAIMFRNLDVCLKDGCCKSFKYSCDAYDPLYIDEYDPSDPSLRGINFKAAEIILKFSAPTGRQSDVVKVGDIDVSMTYLNKKVDIIVELTSDQQAESMTFDDCFNAVKVYIQLTSELVSDLREYGVITVRENEQRGYFRFRSTSRQTSQELTKLLRLRRQVRCEVNGGNALMGTLRPMHQNDGVDAKRYNLRFQSLTSKYELTKSRNRVSSLCQNVSIRITTGSTEIKGVDLKCLDETTLKNSADSEACAILTKILVAVLVFMTYCF